jgi:hypothetical protein
LYANVTREIVSSPLPAPAILTPAETLSFSILYAHEVAGITRMK